MTRVDGWTEDPVQSRVSGPYPPPRSDAGRWQVRLSTRDGDVTITAPNAISTEAMREAMRAYWGGATYQTSIGVGDGSGNLYVHGEYEACKRVQDLIEENRVLRARVRDLGEKT